eukprot:Lithocolla_globosa_v1_NODE_1555_length_2489_cov_9.147083.p3 type:complete len:102 gc:universal NODE_1555_length_2489_cov_9.147083:127-432(+)
MTILLTNKPFLDLFLGRALNTFYVRLQKKKIGGFRMRTSAKTSVFARNEILVFARVLEIFGRVEDESENSRTSEEKPKSSSVKNASFCTRPNSNNRILPHQ